MICFFFLLRPVPLGAVATKDVVVVHRQDDGRLLAESLHEGYMMCTLHAPQTEIAHFSLGSEGPEGLPRGMKNNRSGVLCAFYSKGLFTGNLHRPLAVCHDKAQPGGLLTTLLDPQQHLYSYVVMMSSPPSTTTSLRADVLHQSRPESSSGNDRPSRRRIYDANISLLRVDDNGVDRFHHPFQPPFQRGPSCHPRWGRGPG